MKVLRWTSKLCTIFSGKPSPSPTLRFASPAPCDSYFKTVVRVAEEFGLHLEVVDPADLVPDHQTPVSPMVEIHVPERGTQWTFFGELHKADLVLMLDILL